MNTGTQAALASIVHESYDEHGRRLTVGRIAERMGERESYLAPRLSPYDDTHTLPWTKVVGVTHATRNGALIEHLCRETGYVPVKLPKVDAANIDVIEHAGAAAKEFGDVMAEAGKALADGRVKPDEADAFRKQAHEAVAAIMQFVQLMDAKAGIQPLRAVKGA